MNNGEICGTHTPTGHYILIEAHFEPPYGRNMSSLCKDDAYIKCNLNTLELQIEDVGEFSSKLELLNTYMEQEMVAWQHEQNRNHQHPYGLYSQLFA